jgi:hypothetical protein
MTAEELVAEFERLTAQCLDALLQDYSGLTRGIRPTLQLIPRAEGPPVRVGELEGLGEFRLHGLGCRFELFDGRVVDIDWDFDGRAIFDSWRVLRFARSLGDEATTQQDIRHALDQSPILWLVRDDWFTWADRSYDITWGDGATPTR